MQFLYHAMAPAPHLINSLCNAMDTVSCSRVVFWIKNAMQCFLKRNFLGGIHGVFTCLVCLERLFGHGFWAVLSRFPDAEIQTQLLFSLFWATEFGYACYLLLENFEIMRDKSYLKSCFWLFSKTSLRAIAFLISSTDKFLLFDCCCWRIYRLKRR